MPQYEDERLLRRAQRLQRAFVDRAESPRGAERAKERAAATREPSNSTIGVSGHFLSPLDARFRAPSRRPALRLPIYRARLEPHRGRRSLRAAPDSLRRAV